MRIEERTVDERNYKHAGRSERDALYRYSAEGIAQGKNSEQREHQVRYTGDSQYTTE